MRGRVARIVATAMSLPNQQIGFVPSLMVNTLTSTATLHCLLASLRGASSMLSTPTKTRVVLLAFALQYKQILDDNGSYIAYQMPNGKPRGGESAVFNFLNNINIDSDDNLNPFMSLTILPLNLPDRQEEERIGTRRRRSKNGVLTSSGLIDSGAIDSDYISLTLFNSISNKLGYTLDTLHVDTKKTWR